MQRISAFVASAAVLASACAAPRVPSEYPPGSPASAQAEAAPTAPVAPMLRDDPPLPGDDRAEWQQWPGLDRSVKSEHTGHGDAHGDRPASDAPPPEEPEHRHDH